MKKIVFVCLKDNTVDVIKVTDKASLIREKNCSKCNTKMNFIHRNKKKYKLVFKKMNKE